MVEVVGFFAGAAWASNAAWLNSRAITMHAHCARSRTRQYAACPIRVRGPPVDTQSAMVGDGEWVGAQMPYNLTILSGKKARLLCSPVHVPQRTKMALMLQAAGLRRGAGFVSRESNGTTTTVTVCINVVSLTVSR